MPHFITTHSINNPNYIKMQQNKNQQLDAKFRKFIKVLIMGLMWKTSSVYRRHHYLQVDVNTASTLYQLMLFLPYSYLILGYTPQR